MFGDAFFNLAVMWVVWSETQSTLYTAVVQAIWHIPDVLFAPLAGVLADRWDRKGIMVATNVAAAAVVTAAAVVVIVVGHLPPVVAFVAVFKLNSLTAFLNPARASVMPSIVGRDLLTSAQGLFSTARQVASLVGSAAAGLLIAVTGAVWVLVIDAVSFVFVSLCVALARIPGRTETPSDGASSVLSVGSVARDLRDGWQTASQLPVVRALLWLGVFINVGSFMGPLWPALVQKQLGGGPVSYGLLEATGVAGGMFGGLLAGSIERRVGAGRAIALGWGTAGVCIIGIAVSRSLPATMVLEFADSFAMVVASVASAAIMMVSVPEEYRGRVFGIVRGMSVFLIPASALAGGWVAEFVEISVMYTVGGIILLTFGILALANPHLRTARV